MGIIEISNAKRVSLMIVIFNLILNLIHGQVEVMGKTTGNRDALFFIEGQLCQHLRKIFQDRQGNLWFGTNVYDLMMYNGDSLTRITENEGFSGGRVTGIVQDESGDIWFATGFGLNRYDGKSFTVYAEQDGLSNSEIWSLMLDSDGILWIGHNKGLSRFDGKDFVDIPVPKPDVREPNTVYAPDRITGIVEDSEGNIWLGTDGFGICRYNGGLFTHFTMDDGICDNAVNELMVDRQGNLWIGTYFGGVSRYDGEEFNNYTRDELVSGVEVGGFFEDTNGEIWFAVENNGVYRFDGKTFTHLNQEAFLNGSILCIYRDKETRLWLGGWGGLFRYVDKSIVPVTKDGPWE